MEKLRLAQESKEGLPSQNYLILSENGFGGQKYRLIKRYLKTAGVLETSRTTDQIEDVFVTTTERQNPNGTLSTIKTRKGSIKIELATFSVTDQADLDQYLTIRNPTKGKLTLSDFSTTTMSPTEYCLGLLKQKITERSTPPEPIEKVKKLIVDNSFFSPQNLDEIYKRLEDKNRKGGVFKIGVFACLNMKCYEKDGLPAYLIGQEENRLETPRVSKRTNELLSLLKNSGIQFTWDFLLADTDPQDVYGDWLKETNLTEQIDKYKSRLAKNTSNSPDSCIRLWSSIQSPYIEQYQKDFNETFNQCEQLVGSEYIMTSTKRRLKYFTEKIGLPYSNNLVERQFDIIRSSLSTLRNDGFFGEKE